jgi:hypothetical protein
MGRVAALTYPTLDFPVYGADDTWAGPRWLQHLDGAGGRPLGAVWLAHGPHAELFEGPGPWLEVGTVPRRRWAEGPAAGHLDPAGEAAFLAWLARSDGSGDEVDAARESAAAYQEWGTATWLVDGVAVEARIVPPGPGGARWAGFVETGPVFVVVVAQDLRADVRLADVGDGASHHADLTRPLAFPDDIEASRRRA